MDSEGRTVGFWNAEISEGTRDAQRASKVCRMLRVERRRRGNPFSVSKDCRRAVAIGARQAAVVFRVAEAGRGSHSRSAGKLTMPAGSLSTCSLAPGS